MAIIPINYLEREMPTDDTEDQDEFLTSSINEATEFCNTNAVNYELWPDYDSDTGIPVAPNPIPRICLQVAKIYYYQATGRIARDGLESENLNETLAAYSLRLKTIDIQPTIYSATISLNSDGVQLIARSQHILRHHQSCKVVSGSSNIWNQGFHWDIRRGDDSETEYLDGWYFDAETYRSTIEGTLYYARSWKNNFLDYQRYENSNNG